jgi:hypothetical protein
MNNGRVVRRKLQRRDKTGDAFERRGPIVFRRNDNACVSAKAEYHREQYIFPRQQSLITRELLWEERLPKIPHWGSNRVANWMWELLA